MNSEDRRRQITVDGAGTANANYDLRIAQEAAKAAVAHMGPHAQRYAKTVTTIDPTKQSSITSFPLEPVSLSPAGSK